jgi:TPR repeat protein
MELYARAAKLGSSKAHCFLADIYHSGGDFKTTLAAAAMAGCEVSRFNLGVMEANAGNKERAIKHFRIAASAGCFRAMSTLLIVFKQGHVNRDAIDALLTAYNNSCAEMRSKARDLFIQIKLVEEEEKSLELLN